MNLSSYILVTRFIWTCHDCHHIACPPYGVDITDGSLIEPSVIPYHRRFHNKTVCDIPTKPYETGGQAV